MLNLDAKLRDNKCKFRVF